MICPPPDYLAGPRLILDSNPGSKSSLHTPDPGDSERKRAGSPSPGTSKQRREVTSAASSTSGGDARGSGGDETRRMQHEISMGFDRLIAMASEVDKRRKSAENSPVQVATNTLPFDQFKSRELYCF